MTNIVERIMSILNIGFQNVALERSCTASDSIIDSCKNLDDMRKHQSEIKNDWQKSAQPIVDTLISRTKRLALKDISFQCWRVYLRRKGLKHINKLLRGLLLQYETTNPFTWLWLSHRETTIPAPFFCTFLKISYKCLCTHNRRIVCYIEDT